MDLKPGIGDLLDAEVFRLIQGYQIDKILSLPRNSVQCLLPSLVRYALLEAAGDSFALLDRIRQASGSEDMVNEMIELYEQVDFERIASDAMKELRWRAKLADTGDSQSEQISELPQHSSYVSALSKRGNLTSVFERSDSLTKVRIILSELLRCTGDSRTNSADDLFASPLYTETISNIVCVIYTELLPAMSQVQNCRFDENSFLNALLHMRFGATVIVRLVLNCPSVFDAVCNQVVDGLACCSSNESRPEAGSKGSRLQLLQRASDPQNRKEPERATHARRCAALLRSLAKLGGPIAVRRIREAVCNRRVSERAVEELVLALTLELCETCDNEANTFAFDSANSRESLEELLSFVSCALLSTCGAVRTVSDVALQSPTAVAETVAGALFECAPPTPRGVSRRRTSLGDAASPPRESRAEDLRSPKAAKERDMDPRSPRSGKGKGPTAVSFQDIKDRLFSFASFYTLRLTEACDEATVHEATRLVRVLVALKLSGAVARLAEDELSALITLLTVRVDSLANVSLAQALDTFSTVCVCGLIALCSQLVSAEQERRVADWLTYLLHDGAQRTNALSECVETLLVLALHCHAVNVNAEQQSNAAWNSLNAFVAELFTCQFGVLRGSSVPQRVNQYSKAVRLVVKVLTEDVLTHCLERFDCTCQGGFVPPLACVTQLVARSGRLERERSALPIGSWLLAHIVRVHEQFSQADSAARADSVQQLVLAIDAYVSALATSHYTAPRSATLRRLDSVKEEDLVGHFNELALFRFACEHETHQRLPEPSCVAKHVLLAYYVVALQDAYLEQLARNGNAQLSAVQQSNAHASTLSGILNGTAVVPFSYSDRLVLDVPVVYLLRRARFDRVAFGACLPKLLRIVVARRLEVRDVDSRLLAPFDSLDPPVRTCFNREPDCESDAETDSLAWRTAFNKVLHCEQPDEKDRAEVKLVAMFDRLLIKVRAQNHRYLVPLLRAVEATLHFLSVFLRSQKCANCKLFERIREAWLRVHAVAPRKLALLTAKAFGAAGDVQRGDQLVRDPLLVARCVVQNPRLCQLAACFELYLKTVQTFLMASRTYYTELLLRNVLRVGPSAVGYQPNGGLQAALAAALGRKLVERDELFCNLLQSQQAAIVHLLIELCCEEQVEAQFKSCNLAEIRPLACAFLHSVFIEEPQLIKLVHFQTYPLSALRTLVRYVPSLHCALEFVPELLTLPHRDTQLFAVRLAACLAERYAVPRAAQNARLCIELMFTLLGADKLAERVTFFTRAVDALVLFATAFPPLAADCVRLLVAVARSCCPTQLRKSAALDIPFIVTEMLAESETQAMETSVDDEELPELPGDDASKLYARIRRCYADICKGSTMLQYLI